MPASVGDRRAAIPAELSSRNVERHRACFARLGMTQITRRELITGTALALTAESLAHSELAHGDVIEGGLPWKPGLESTPQEAHPGPWRFFTSAERATAEALADRIIPSDPHTPGGKDA